jgi:type II secretory pathway component PulK
MKRIGRQIFCFGRRRDRRGTVLIIVMWVALVLVSLALYFGGSMGMEYRAADNSLAGSQADQAIKGAGRYVTKILDELEEPGIAPDLELGEYLAEDVPIGDARFWLIGRDTNGTIEPQEPVFGLVDEASKLNLNTATVEMLEALPGMTRELAAAIVDWRDLDSDVTPGGGAEAQDYLARDPSYNAKDSDFETPDELRLVLGMDFEALYGEDANLNGVLDPNEDDGDASWPPDNSNGRLDAGLLEYVTTFSREPNTRADGQARINLGGNQAQQQLTELLTERFGAERAGQIMGSLGPQLSSVNSVAEFYAIAQLYGMTAEEFQQIEGDISAGGGEYQVGLVNVRTASSAVLACLPGMDPSLADQLVAARRGKDTESLKSTAWVSEALDPAVAAQIGPFITARSYQYSVDIAALGHDGRGFRRVRMVVDTEDTAKVIYRRDMTRAGWPLGTRDTEETRRSGRR